MSNIKTETCPHCGNIVEGRKIKSYTNKVTRQGAKTAAHMATSAGGMATGAAVGSAILPGVGTLVGGALGFIGSAMFNQKVNEGIDKVGDSVEDEFLMMNYEFRCPKCGHTWIHHESEILGEQQQLDTSTIYTIYGVIAEKLNVDVNVLSPNVSLEDLGADELDISEILMELEKVFNISSKKDPFEDFTFVDDFIEEFTGESMWDADAESSTSNEDQDYEDSQEDEDERFKAFFNSYLNDEYVNLNISELSNMLVKEAKLCSNAVVASQYYCVAAVASTEYFVIEWLNNKFKNYQGKQQQLSLQRTCLIDGFENIQNSRNILPDDKEYQFISGVLSLLKDFWVESCYDKDYIEELYGTLPDLCKNADNFLFNTEWLNKLYTAIYTSILECCENNNSSSVQNSAKDSEQEYLEELKEILADGEISQRERRLLDKIRVKLGISEARAEELEASLSRPSLSTEEQEYLDEYKEIVSEGDISARDQRFLDKLKKANGISDERAKEIEKLV